MISVKIELCSLGCYLSSSTAIVLYNRMYMCKMFSSNRQKLKKCDLHKISSASPKAYGRLANEVIPFVMQNQFLVKFMSLNKSVKLKFLALLAKTSKNL